MGGKPHAQIAQACISCKPPSIYYQVQRHEHSPVLVHSSFSNKSNYKKRSISQNSSCLSNLLIRGLCESLTTAGAQNKRYDAQVCQSREGTSLECTEPRTQLRLLPWRGNIGSGCTASVPTQQRNRSCVPAVRLTQDHLNSVNWLQHSETNIKRLTACFLITSWSAFAAFTNRTKNM